MDRNTLPLRPDHDTEGPLLRMLRASLERDPGPVTRASRVDELGLDELARAHFTYSVEQAFHVRLDPGHGPRPETLGEVLERVEQRTFWTYPEPPHGTALDLARGGFLIRFLRPPVQALFRLFLRLYFRYRARGKENLPRKGPFIIVSNHNGHADAPALVAAVRLRRVNETHPLAAQDYFFKRKWVATIVHFLVNALPIDRTQPAERALKAALDLLAEGRGIVLFPEGTRSMDGSIQPFKKGIGLLAAAKSYPVIPAYITGSRDVLPKGRSWPRRATLRVRFGTPRTFAAVPDTREGWKDIAATLEHDVRHLAAQANPQEVPTPAATAA